MVHAEGVVAVLGWADDLARFERALLLNVGGKDRPPSHTFRVRRPDVDAVFASSTGFRGAIAEWSIEPHPRSLPAVLRIDGDEALRVRLPAAEAIPYSHLRTHRDIVSRDGIYGFGNPVHTVLEEVHYLARRLPPPILDFGCGGGALVRELRRDGIEAYGLELDDDRIRTHLLDEVRPHVTLYDGRFPAPFADGQFASVVSSEVLEHIPQPTAALAEIARLAARKLLITVPDSSAIPRGFPHRVVPWHLLESTHVNFFTQYSLDRALAPYVSRVEMSRIGHVSCNRMSYYTSLAAVAERSRIAATEPEPSA
jgi:SAM-dependent methyltransferase